MTFWQRLVKFVPRNDIENEHDIVAWIGFRFAWMTGPTLLMAFAFSLFGRTEPLLGWWTLILISIPYGGAIVDWRRLQRRTKRDNGNLQ
jgi:hypothetical protein